MSEKKELNQEELEQVTGGFKYYHKVENVKFKFTKGTIIMAKLETCSASSTITSRGCYALANGYIPCYYLEVDIYSDKSGWYTEDYLDKGDRVYEKVTESVIVID